MPTQTTPTISEIVAFHEALTGYYYQFGRHDMLWRQPDDGGRFDPYKIMVSELMLQQTQVDRVTPKYQEFLRAYPQVQNLAAAELGDVLQLWNGLGYNRRAKFIWQAARTVVSDFENQFPDTPEALQKLPGVGPNTAGAIMAYAYDQPVVFVETNIRTVIIHHFYKDETAVPDARIRDVLQAVVPQTGHPARRARQGAVLSPREFYWATMDYGSHLKKSVGNLSRASKHYTRQSTFHGSLRQVRGQVIRLLTAGPLTMSQLNERLADERLDDVVDALMREEMIVRAGSKLRLG